MDRTLTPVTSIDDGFAGWNVPTEDDDLHDLDDDLSLLREDFAHVEHPLIGCVIPAYNEESTIGDVIQSLLDQTLTPDEIHVVINNSNDRTLQKAREFAGVHRKSNAERTMVCAVYIHDIGKNAEKKVGALNYGLFHDRALRLCARRRRRYGSRAGCGGHAAQGDRVRSQDRRRLSDFHRR
ncbi:MULTISPECIES: glycosyltransferase [Bifidobacterium]|uniref:Glycosyltransferase n=1 Tax=Bifidobacterium tibiigranuli TaxID=2172043 RepID=A0A5N6S6J7_9BIFI|nr:glycosyltransferase [Bifidobacterium tibiigranuli]KAE8129231.1 glycosyltransferase [Bifidobacterium tibiigranuli]KAE8129469.1 hypothetical protein DDF78_03740 [Bifidobacterium tibiigranuli]MCH3975447.1 glycosyltransferase [Bifidobacterium tibiigranuli]MCH4190496.1 glycosyltransferase [Bifidobacterium tibiigranuli]MCH4204194.1 glycosyltransferase [Bifidobacterium tibiigranuli]